MGMYDSINILSISDAEKIRCPAGHRFINTELQTKDLECAMLNYYVEGGRLFLANKTKAALEPPVVQGDSLILTRREEARFVPVTLNVVAYTNCEECLPV